MHLFHFLKKLQNERGNDSDDYIPVPKILPEFLQRATSKESYHDHVYHLNRSADDSVFIAEPGTERRDIYRSIEPVWVCTKDAAPQEASEASPDGLITLDKTSQKILEKAHQSHLTHCHLTDDSTTGPCTVLFGKDVGNNVTHASSRTLIVGKDIKRLSTPMWWFKVETNELNSFDWKNQVRLEAYEDYDSTLTLTDKSFSDPFTVALKKNNHQGSKETEWQGFMYLDTIPRVGLNSANVNDNKETEDVNYRDLCIQGIDDFPNFNKFAQDDELQEQRDEEKEIKYHVNQNVK